MLAAEQRSTAQQRSSSATHGLGVTIHADGINEAFVRKRRMRVCNGWYLKQALSAFAAALRLFSACVCLLPCSRRSWNLLVVRVQLRSPGVDLGADLRATVRASYTRVACDLVVYINIYMPTLARELGAPSLSSPRQAYIFVSFYERAQKTWARC